MKILALEFSSERRSVAVVEQGAVLGEAHEQGGKHTRAFELIEQALLAARIERERIECVAVGLGPGSYMGIRIAIAIAQGWQLARGVKTAGVKSADEARQVGLLVEEKNEFVAADKLEPIYLRPTSFVKAPPTRTII